MSEDRMGMGINVAAEVSFLQRRPIARLLETYSRSNGALAFRLDIVIEDTSVVTLLSAVVVAA
jgi:hypothetical protein